MGRLIGLGLIAAALLVMFTGRAAALEVGQSPTPVGQSAETAGPDTSNYVLVLLKLGPQHLRPNGGYSDSYGDGVGRNERRKVATRLARHHGLKLVEDWAMPLVGVDCYVMAVPAGQSTKTVSEMLSHEPGVEWSEPMNTYHALGVIDRQEPLFPAQPAAQAWRLADLHQMATGRAIRVAVVDSMVDAAHPDLSGQVEFQENFVTGRAATPEQHGTGVAGVIAARGDNKVGIVGVAPNARLMALRACWQQPSVRGRAGGTVCDSLGLAKAINFAIVHKAQIINMSLAGPPDPLLQRLLDVAITHGITVVGAYDRNMPSGGFPADYPGVIAVSDSGAGPAPAGSVSAPGHDIPTTQVAGQWYFVNGSSYSAAHVSGLIALLRERSPRMRASTALVTARPGGEIDVCATLMRVAGPCDCACAHDRALSMSAH